MFEADIAHSNCWNSVSFLDVPVSFNQMYITEKILKKLPKTRAAVGISLNFILQVHFVVFS